VLKVTDMAEVTVPRPPTPEEVGKRVGELVSVAIKYAPPRVVMELLHALTDTAHKTLEEMTKAAAEEIRKGPPGAPRG